MKVLLHYEDNSDPFLHKSLKITLPKSWKSGPTSRLLSQFVETYNQSETLGATNPLDEKDLHLATRKYEGGVSKMVALASDAVVLDSIVDRGDVYIIHGASQTVAEIKSIHEAAMKQKQEEMKNTVQCTRYGCNNRFPPGGPYPPCQYHASPPVFHETAKYWSCCPSKKAYDWDDFQNIPGCQKTECCTEVKEEEGQKTFLGGVDLRALYDDSTNLKSIDDFNRAQAAGGSEAAPVLDRLKSLLREFGIEEELYNQVVDCMKVEFSKTGKSDGEVLEAIKGELGNKLKTMMKSIAVEQLRIK